MKSDTQQTEANDDDFLSYDLHIQYHFKKIPIFIVEFKYQIK